ncbi:MAG TPA: hypothetical protein VJ749_06385 [Pyrinomonadaceae bacterium]|nr:hypothetical protein [Pyrinomonadaceae bacterium]
MYLKKLRLLWRWFPPLLFDHELICIHQTDIGNQQRAQIDSSGKHRVEVDVHDAVRLTIQYGIELRKDSSDGRNIFEHAPIDFENREQIVIGDELYLETVAGLLLVRPKDLERPAIVGRHQQVISIPMRKITLQTNQMLLDHPAHRIIRRITPAIEWNMNQRLDSHLPSRT